MWALMAATSAETSKGGVSLADGLLCAFTVFLQSVRTNWPGLAQRLAPVRPVSPVGAARTVRAVGADFFVLAQHTKAIRSIFCVVSTATPIFFCWMGNQLEPVVFCVGQAPTPI